MAVTRSTTLNKSRSFVVAMTEVAPRALPKQSKKPIVKPKKTPRKAAKVKATAKTAIVKVPVVTQQNNSSATDKQLPMITIPTDVIYSLNNTRMQHFIVDVKDEIDTSVGVTLSQSLEDCIGQDPPRSDSRTNLMESPISISSAAQLVEQTTEPAKNMNVRQATDLGDYGDYGIPKVEPSSQRGTSELDENTVQDNDTNIDSLTVVEDSSQCPLGVVNEEILSTNESFSESIDYSRENASEESPAATAFTIPIDSFSESVDRLSNPARIKENNRMDLYGLEDFPDHLSHLSDVSMLSLENASVNGQYQSSSPNDSSHAFEPLSTSRREFTCTDQFQSPNFPNGIAPPDKYSNNIIDRIEERRLCTSSERKNSERMEIGDEQEQSYSPTRTIIKSDFADGCPSPTRTIIKTDLTDDFPSPTRAIIKSDLTDECPSPTITIIKSESESEDYCRSPTGTIIKDNCSSPTSTAFINAKARVAYQVNTNNIRPEHGPSTRNRRNSREAVQNNRHAGFLHSDHHTRHISFDSCNNSSLKQSCETERWHQNSLSIVERTSKKRFMTTNRRSSSPRTLYSAVFPVNRRSSNKFHRLPSDASETESHGNFEERVARHKRVYEIDSESDLQRGKRERYSSKGTSTNRNRGFQTEWPERKRIESEMTDDGEPDYGWEDPPPPKPKSQTIKSRDVEPTINEKMQMFMGTLNNEFDLDVIEASKKKLLEAIDESIAIQSTKKLNELDQKIRKKKDDYLLNLFGTDDFESWNDDPALSNVKGTEKLKPNKSSSTAADVSLLDKMTMKHLMKRNSSGRY